MADSNRLLTKPVTKNSKDSHPKETLKTSQKVTAAQPYQPQSQQSFSLAPSGASTSTSSDSKHRRFQEPVNGNVQEPTNGTVENSAKSCGGASPASETYESLHDDTDKLIKVQEDIKPDPKTIKSEPQASSISGTKGKGKNGIDKSTAGVVVEKPELTSIPQTNFAIGFLVMCCFNLPFGLLALYFSLRAAAAYRDGNKTKGASRARTSIVLSLIGIMLTMVIVSSVVLYIAVNKHGKRPSRRPSSSALGF